MVITQVARTRDQLIVSVGPSMLDLLAIKVKQSQLFTSIVCDSKLFMASAD
jgi:hypothetical protein